MDSCLLVGSTEYDLGHPVQEHSAEQRVIEYSEADYGASAAAAAATAVENVCIALENIPRITH